MNFMKLFAASLAVVGILLTPTAQAHVTYNTGTGAAPIWGASGAPAEWLPADATLPSNGYLGIHSIGNKKVVQTGLYQATAVAADLGGAWAGATPAIGDSSLGQAYKYNVTNDPTNTIADHALQEIKTTQGSWAAGVSDANTGLSWSNPHFSSSTLGSAGPNQEKNLLDGGVGFINITVGDDPLFSGANQLAFSLYQGWAKGPGLTGLNLLHTGLASAAGQDIGVALQLTGNQLNGVTTAGEYTIVVGDQSSGTGFDGHYRLALVASTSAIPGYSVVSAVPVPGAVWLFGSALAGLVGYGRRKQLAA